MDNYSWASRKDFREAVVTARSAFDASHMDVNSIVDGTGVPESASKRDG